MSLSESWYGDRIGPPIIFREFPLLFPVTVCLSRIL